MFRKKLAGKSVAAVWLALTLAVQGAAPAVYAQENTEYTQVPTQETPAQGEGTQGGSAQEGQSAPSGSSGQESQSAPSGSSGQESQSAPSGSSGQESQSAPSGSTGQESQSAPGGSTGQESQSALSGSTGQESQSAPGGSSGQENQAAPNGSSGQENNQQAPDGTEGQEGQESQKTPDGTEGQEGQEAPDGTEGQEGQEAPDGTEGQEGQKTPGGTEGQEGQSAPDGTESQEGQKAQEGQEGQAESDGTQSPDTTAEGKTRQVVQGQEVSAQGQEEIEQGQEVSAQGQEVSGQGQDPNAQGEDSVSAASQGVYYYGSKQDQKDIPDTYVYKDDFLKGDSKTYSAGLATMSLSMINASIASKRVDYPDKSQNLRAFLEDNGFSDFEANEDYKKEPTLNTMGVACAHKQITDNGKTYTLLVIAPRSAGYKTEWGGNFDVGKSGDHEGFAHARDIVLAFAKEYVRKYGITGEIKVWTAGGSRGAGVINLVGAELLRDPKAALGDTVTLTPDNLYCYTFGTPKAADSTQADFDANNNGLYAYIHNLAEPDDVVGTFAPSELGFDRYGQTTGYVDESLKGEMLSFLLMTSEALYNAFTNGGDPDGFKSMTIDLSGLFSGGGISIKPTTKGYLAEANTTQEDFMRLLEGTMKDVFVDRDTYAAKYQEPLMHFFGYVYGGSGEFGTLFKGIKDSGYMIPTVATMYISVVLQQFVKSKTMTWEQAKQDINDAITKLEEKYNISSLAPELNSEYENLKNRLEDVHINIDEIRNGILDKSWKIAAGFYGKAMASALKNITTISEENKKALASESDSLAMTKLLGNMLLIDRKQEQHFGFRQLGQNFLHLATVMGNAKSFMTPHYNEVILSWLRASDPEYEGLTKANAAQTTGYRRVYVEQPAGVDVTGTVKDSAGNVVAVFKNGILEYSTNKWIDITTSDGGNWLRLPIDDTYRIDFSISGDTVINVKVSEYSVFDGEEVRVETSDSKYSWQNLALRTIDTASLVVSAIAGNVDGYKLNSGAEYYLDLLKRFYITYLLDGGSLNGTGEVVTWVCDDGTQIALPVPVKKGYRFAYWEGSRYKAGDIYTVLADHVFRAVWEKISSKKDKKDNDKKSKRSSSGSDSSQAAVYTGTNQGLLSANNAAVNTADHTPVEIWIMIMGASMLIAAYLLLMRRGQMLNEGDK